MVAYNLMSGTTLGALSTDDRDVRDGTQACKDRHSRALPDRRAGNLEGSGSSLTSGGDMLAYTIFTGEVKRTIRTRRRVARRTLC